MQRSKPRTPRDLYDATPSDLSDLMRHWKTVTDDSPTCGSRSGGWHVRKEHEGDRLGPPFHEVAVYVRRGYRLREVGRWGLGAEPDDPRDAVRERLGLEDDE